MIHYCFDHGVRPGSSTRRRLSLLAAKDAENAALRNENAALLTRVTELEGLVAALHAQLGRDSSNSGRPPSSDSPFVKARRQALLTHTLRQTAG